MNKNFKLIFQAILITATAAFCINMGTSTYKRNTVKKGPEFFKLKVGRPVLSATIIDGKSSGEFQNIRFFDPSNGNSIKKNGETKFSAFSQTVGNDSLTEVDLEKIQEIEIVQSVVEAKSNVKSNLMFSIIRVVPNKGRVIENLLAPRDIEVCAKSVETGLTQSWFLHTINRITDIQIATAKDMVNETKPTWYPQDYGKKKP